MTTEPTDPTLGRVLGGQYRIDTLLGQGGMGSVYRGVQLSVNRSVAVKLITATTGGAASPNQPELVNRFRREAEATARLSHPNTVRLFDFGVTEGNELYMVMELLEGADLGQQLQAGGAMPRQAALQVTRQVLAALSEAHALGIVHRDLKPANVFLSRVHGGDTIAKVMDFGIAGIEQARETQKLTMTGAVIGTPAYMSPEQAQGKPVDARSDLYSLGVVLFEMLTGRPPFEADTVVSLLLAHVTAPPPRLAAVAPQLAQLPALQDLLDSLLSKTLEGRPPSAAVALAAVDALLGGDTARPLRSSQSPQLAAGLSATAQAATPLTWTAAQPGSQAAAGVARGKLMALGAGAAALLALAAYWGLRPTAPQTTETSASPAASAGNESGGAEAHTVTIASTPSGARVLLGGAELGTTPYALQLRHETVVGITLAGYLTQTLHVTPNSDPNLVVTLVPDPAASKLPSASPAAATMPRGRMTAAPKASSATADTARVGAAKALRAPEPVTAIPPAPATTTAAAVPATPSTPTPTAVPARAAAHAAAEPPPPTASARRSPVGEVTHAVGGLMSSIFGRGGGSSGDARARRQAMLSAPPYPSVAAAKHALDAGQITAQQYADAIWVLKTRRKQRIEAEKANLRSGAITEREYKWRIQTIDTEYQGN